MGALAGPIGRRPSSCCATRACSQGTPQARGGITAENRTVLARLAYLIDLQTIRVMDLLTNATLATISHDTRIDWLELNHRGTHLLFRDKKRHLSLYNIAKQERTTLLNYSGYVQWVPQSDVVVAQSRDNLCVWYSFHTPDRVSMFPIKGELMDIERNNNRTEASVRHSSISRHALPLLLLRPTAAHARVAGCFARR